ncbi:MAG: N-6 DNA methylase, partial [Bacteroidales bacterium]|nr:N-6 DNA methylase [Bacteroidales bacterium]
MAFFQNSVINKHLKALDKEVVKAAYAKFRDYFHNPEIQQNIRDAKEEQFQEGFLRELFVKILGYTLNPQPNYNLTTELKNEKGAKKADGAILSTSGGAEGRGKEAIGVIELKSTKTKDLDKINNQAFNYKNNQTGCIYVITSNFEKLRFFIHNSVNHIEFNLFTLTKQEFELLWLCLSADSLLGGVPLKAKEESLLAEENITKQLYKDYSSFKNDLWQSMVKNSPEADQLLLFKKTQKLLDRFLFIFFGEDSGLLPPNSISRIVKRWNILKEEDAYKPLYDIFKQYFGYINTGREGKTSQDDIFAYNGGLFFADEVLDADYINKGLQPLVDDDVLHPHVMKLTAYDFQSEVDVNILGHIFENSLNEIENVIAQLKGQEVDKSKTKRKKDGVFYTPKYITKYIVDNTVGKLCEEKKAKLNIIDEEYAKGRRNRKKETVKKLDKSLQAYREWLLNITICDPACGSGAFLNQALEFLIEEHEYIDELQAQLFEESIVFQDVSNHILEKNIYGVDINEESVDIAKLSLWLRTAQRGRKLTSLNNNLKCGNSLIDDPEVAGEKAFNWNMEFPQVFKEKEKKAWHITTATHNSRYSQRMFDNYVKLGEAVWMSEKDEILVTKTIANIVKEDNLNIISYNICGDHMHILLVCEDEELPKIAGKIKAVSARKYNIEKGITVPATT